MTFQTDPFENLGTVYSRIVHNLSKIDTADGDSVKVDYCKEAAVPIRPEDLLGATITVVDTDENETQRRPNNFARLVFAYDINLWIIEEDPMLLPEKLRKFCDDVWRRHHSDLRLATADGELGGSGDEMLVSHRILTVRRDYSPPDGIAVITVEGEYDFLVS